MVWLGGATKIRVRLPGVYNLCVRQGERNAIVLEDVDEKLECAAHHEAGHVAIAAAEGLRLRSEGIFVDPLGEGLGCYCKEPDGSDLSRKRIIVATFAGFYAQGHFCEERSRPAPYQDWFLYSTDGLEARTMLCDLSLGSLSNGSVPATQTDLQERSEQLVGRHWVAIKALATALLAKDWEPQKPLKSGGKWSDAAVAKYLRGQEIVGLLAHCGIAAACDPDC